MPELPEIETLRIQFTPVLKGQIISDIEAKISKSFQGDKNLIIGSKIKDVRRFAKILVIDLDNGLALAVHLKLTGQLVYRGKKQPKKLNITDKDLSYLPNKFTRVIVSFRSDDNLFFNDTRMFGWIKIVRDLDQIVGKLGPEPFKDLTKEKFEEILKSSKRPVKIILMDQEKIGGVGNIYANEALFLSKIHPKTPGNELSKEKIFQLYSNLLEVLKLGLKWGGSSENNFRNAFGELGQMQKHVAAYGRDGGKCINNCGGIVKRITLGGRGTFYCPKCQG